MLNHLLLGQSLLRTPTFVKTPRVRRTAQYQWLAFLHRRRMARDHGLTR